MSTRLPAEWETQDAVIIAWPHVNSDWQPTLSQAHTCYIDICQQLSKAVALIVVVPQGRSSDVRVQIGDTGKHPITLVELPYNDTWARDFGPITVYKNNRPTILDFQFNGWGNKFTAELDNAINRQLSTLGILGNTPVKTLPLILEGGAIESDGNGTLLTTSQCLFNPNRNPSLSQDDIEAQLRENLGVHTIHWLQHGYLAGDDTDSHIDTLARLCPNNTITYVQCDDHTDEHYTELAAMKAELSALRTTDGKPYTLIPLPWPKAVFDSKGARLPATYANFLISNGTVFVPIYGDNNDTLALQQVAIAFPEHTITAINCLALIQQHGSLHCITMQLPRGVLS